MSSMVKFLHSADIHFGAKFAALGERGAAQRVQIRETFLKMIDLACTEQVALVLLAGDTFDNNQPSVETLQVFDQGLRKLSVAQIPLLLIGGTHDPLNEHSVLRNLAQQHPNDLVLFSQEMTKWAHPSLPITVQGVSQSASDQPARPLATMRRAGEAGWHIGMAHASLEMPAGAVREAVFSPAEVAATGMDYLALGHWHSTKNCSAGKTVCWYSGAPEMIATDETQSGSALMVTLQTGQAVQVENVHLGRRSVKKIKVSLEKGDEWLPDLIAAADPDSVLELALQGILPPEKMPDLTALRQKLMGYFFHVRIQNELSLCLDDETIARFPENTVAGRFVRRVKDEMQQAPTQQQPLLKDVLQLGLALLMGRETGL